MMKQRDEELRFMKKILVMSMEINIASAPKFMAQILPVWLGIY